MRILSDIFAAVELEGQAAIESGERCDSALDFPTADLFSVIGQVTVINGIVSITLQPLQCGSAVIFVEAGSDDERGRSGLASAASLVYSVSVFLPSVGPLPQRSSAN